MVDFDPSNALIGGRVLDGKDVQATLPAKNSATVKGGKTPKQAQFCKDQDLDPADGTQNAKGSCSSTPQGQIPAVNKMTSTLIVEPKNGAEIPAKEPINIRVRTVNMQLGSFNNPDKEYYLEPQELNKDGIIIGHQHVVVQEIKDANNPLNAAQFEFFQGLDQPPNGNNDLTAALKDGLNAGEFRMCTITGASGHQPVIMPVAKRGSQDDCIRFTVVAAGQGGQGPKQQAGKNGGAQNQNQAAQIQNQGPKNFLNRLGGKQNNKQGGGKRGGGFTDEQRRLAKDPKNQRDLDKVVEDRQESRDETTTENMKNMRQAQKQMDARSGRLKGMKATLQDQAYAGQNAAIKEYLKDDDDDN
jgi:hypothetical protein